MSEDSDVRTRTDEPAAVADPNLTTADLAGRTPAEQQSDERADDRPTPLFPEAETREFQTRWDSIQASFVDDPRRAVEEADSLVASAIKRLAEQFAEERSRLEGQWDRGDDVSTEDLRVALQRYRSFFGRLLSV